MKYLQFITVLTLLVPGVLLAENKKTDLPFEVPSDPATLPATAVIETSKGPIEISFYREATPITVANFVHLANTGFYENLTFHRYEPGFVIQGGDPEGTGRGGPGYTIPPEFSSTIKHVRGTVAMARLPDQVNLERKSSGSQFYITLAPAPHLNGLYTAFAHVIGGMENVDALRKGDTIEKVRLPE